MLVSIHVFSHLHDHFINKLTILLDKLTTFNPSNKKTIVNIVISLNLCKTSSLGEKKLMSLLMIATVCLFLHELLHTIIITCWLL